MTYFDRILDKHFIDFDKYIDRYCIGREEFEIICKEYAIEMCQLQKENCAQDACTMWGFGCDYDVKIVDQDSILNAPLPLELRTYD